MSKRSKDVTIAAAIAAAVVLLVNRTGVAKKMGA